MVHRNASALVMTANGGICLVLLRWAAGQTIWGFSAYTNLLDIEQRGRIDDGFVAHLRVPSQEWVRGPEE